MSDDVTSTVEAFNRDARNNTGYIYSTNARLSSYLANLRLTQATLAIADLRGQRVIDIGCGDGAYTVELYDRGQPAQIEGIDPAEEAIRIAREKAAGRPIRFAVHSAYDLPYADDSFDIAYLRGVLHHMEQPQAALREALRVAPTIVVVEPNGYNPVLKLLERFSPYHVEHEEKSYLPRRLDRRIEALGGEVTARQFAGLVPMFCPNWMARSLKVIEPIVERLPIVSLFGCAVYVFKATRRG